MPSIVANNGFVLAFIDRENNPSAAWDIISGWGLKGTHITGDRSKLRAPYSPWDAEVDLTTMRVTSTGKLTDPVAIFYPEKVCRLR